MSLLSSWDSQPKTEETNAQFPRSRSAARSARGGLGAIVSEHVEVDDSSGSIVVSAQQHDLHLAHAGRRHLAVVNVAIVVRSRLVHRGEAHAIRRAFDSVGIRPSKRLTAGVGGSENETHRARRE